MIDEQSKSMIGLKELSYKLVTDGKDAFFNLLQFFLQPLNIDHPKSHEEYVSEVHDLICTIPFVMMDDSFQLPSKDFIYNNLYIVYNSILWTNKFEEWSRKINSTYRSTYLPEIMNEFYDWLSEELHTYQFITLDELWSKLFELKHKFDKEYQGYGGKSNETKSYDKSTNG